MKRIFFCFICTILLISIVSCEKEETIEEVKISTLDAQKSIYLTASLSGQVNGPSNILSNAEIGIEYSTDETFSKSTERCKLEGREIQGSFTISITNLQQGITYYYRTYCAYQSNFYYGDTKSFVFNWDGPQVSTLSATFDSNGVIEFVGIVEDLGATLRNLSIEHKNLSYGFECSTNQRFDNDSIIFLIPDKYYSFLGDSVIWYLSEYLYGKQYYYRTFFKDDDVVYYGETKRFVTPAIEITTGILDTTSLIITCHMNDVPIASRNIVYGVCYSMIGQPTFNDSIVTTSSIDNDNSYSLVFPIHKTTIGKKDSYRAFILIDSIPYYGNTNTYDRELLLNGYSYVDLGLSVLWATFNVGAAKPFHYGDYFAWGETEAKIDYNWSNYIFRKSGLSYYDNFTFSKYISNSSYGPVDNKTILDLEDDVAHTKWNGDWRMPTFEEIKELLDPNNCIWMWTTMEDVPGFTVQSRIPGYEGRSIFLPAKNSSSSYWSSTLNRDVCTQAKCLNVYDNGYHQVYNVVVDVSRYAGCSVRPVCQSANWIEKSNNMVISLSSQSESILINNTVTLRASLKCNGENIFYPITWTTDNPDVATVSDDGEVTALSLGTATITATSYNNISAVCVITVREPQNDVIEAVDLGLPVLWATCNIGAEKPEDYGYYFAWGESEYKNEYTWSNYAHCNGSSYSLTKYSNNSSFGINDNKTTLDLEDDAAHNKWGGDWRLPTYEEISSLFSDTIDYGLTTRNGVYGLLIISHKTGYEGNSIFIPASGYRYDKESYAKGKAVCLWANKININSPEKALIYQYSHNVSFNSYYIGNRSYYCLERKCGIPIRPVRPKKM